MSKHPVVVIGISGKLIGVDSVNGQVRWENGMKGGGYGAVALAITDDRIYATAASAVLFCLSYPNGEQLWTAATSASGRGSIIVDGDVVIVSKGGEVDGFSLEGAHLWRQQLKGQGVGRTAVGVPHNVVQADDMGTQ
jgi:outer membrane protein assembly factor BamB